jgi:hypothetical protein
MVQEVLCQVFPKRQIVLLSLAFTFAFCVGLCLIFFDDFVTSILTQVNTLFPQASAETTPYSYFSLGHLAMIGVTFIMFGVTALVSWKKKNWLNGILIMSAVTVIACMAGIAVYSLIVGKYNLELFLPVHICNFFMIVYPLAIIFKGKIRNFFKDYMVWAGIGGCIIATVFPMTSILYYPPTHVVSILCWLHHLVIGMTGIYLIASGNYNRINWFNVVSVIYALCIMSIATNFFLGTNFIFLNLYATKAPISWFQWAFGKYATIIMVGLVTCLVIAANIALDFYLSIRYYLVRDIVLTVKVYLEKINETMQIELDPVVKEKLDIFLKQYGIEINFFMESTVEELIDPVYLYQGLKEIGTIDRFKKFMWNFRKQEYRHELISRLTQYLGV